MGSRLILPNLILESRANLQVAEIGIDSIATCVDKKHFLNYPYDIFYQFNSRGFRDDEWPDDTDKLNHCIWCIGDSVTVGLGQPIDHIWPKVLQRECNSRTINISLEGVGNEWIASKCLYIMQETRPRAMVVTWCCVERRQKTIQQMWTEMYDQCKDSTWGPCVHWREVANLPEYILQELIEVHRLPIDPVSFEFLPDHAKGFDEWRRLSDARADDLENFELWVECLEKVSAAAESVGTRLIHACVPNFASTSEWPRYRDFMTNVPRMIGRIPVLDRARDGLHFDIKTARWFVDRIADHL